MSTSMKNQKISLFFPPKIGKVSFSNQVRCSQSDKPKLIAFEEARNAYIQSQNNAKIRPQDKLHLAQQYMDFLVSYQAFQENIKTTIKNQSNQKLKQQLTDSVYLSTPLFDQKSIFNGKAAVFEEASLERYFTLYQMVALRVDEQLEILSSDVSVAVLKQQNAALKEALGMIENIKEQSRKVCITSSDVRDSALELRLESAENLEQVVAGFFYINSLEQGILINKESLKRDESLAYDHLVLAGFAKSAENAFKQADQQLETYFKQDMKTFNKNYIAFVKSMILLAQMFKTWLYYQHFYDISIDPDAKEIDSENANTQKSLLATQMANIFPNFEKIKIKSIGVSDWFSQRFEKYGIEFKKVADKARKVAGVLRDDAATVHVKPIPYTVPEPIWITLKLPTYDQLISKIKQQNPIKQPENDQNNKEDDKQNKSNNNNQNNNQQNEEKKDDTKENASKVDEKQAANENNSQKPAESDNINQKENQTPKQVEQVQSKQNYPNLPESDDPPSQNNSKPQNVKAANDNEYTNIDVPQAMLPNIEPDEIKEMPVLPSFGDGAPLLPKPL